LAGSFKRNNSSFLARRNEVQLLGKRLKFIQ
jgi:hypothetical protein